MNKSYKKLAEEVVDAWEVLDEGYWDADDIQRWLGCDMKPAIDNIRRKLGRPLTPKDKKL